MDWINLISLLLSPATGVIGWLAGKRKRNNEFLHEMQESINMLAAKNNDLMEELIKVKTQNAQLIVEVEHMRAENRKLNRIVADLSAKLNRN